MNALHMIGGGMGCAVGLTVLAWSLSERLRAIAARSRGTHRLPGPLGRAGGRLRRALIEPPRPAVVFDPDAAYAVDWLDCDTCGGRHVPHETDGGGLVRCVRCHAPATVHVPGTPTPGGGAW